MRPVNKDTAPVDSENNEIQFKKYERARRYLIDAIGEYCSYCERKLVVNLAVEHVKPKSTNKDLELSWSNFLLGCTNCNSTKGAEEITLSDYFWTDIDNTYDVFAYDKSGLVSVSNKIIDADLIEKAQRSIQLVGLDKKPPKTGTVAWKEASDRRFEHRIQAFIDAQEHAENYSTANSQIRSIMLGLIKTIVINQGFWSIWMRAFETFPEVQRELINSFTGTRTEFFQDVLNP